MNTWRMFWLSGLSWGLFSCGQPTAETGDPTPDGAWAATCRLVAQSPQAQAMDASGERFLIGSYLDLDHSSNVELLVTKDGGRTYRPVVAEYLRPGMEGVRLWRFDGSPRGFWLGENHVFVAVVGELVSDIFAADWMAISEDGGQTWTHVLREEGSFEIDGLVGNRRWRSGDAVIVSDGESHFGSLDGGNTFEPIDQPISRLAGDESGLSKWNDGEVELGVELRRGDQTDYTAPYPVVWKDLATGETNEFLVDFGGLPVVEITSVLRRDASSFRAIVSLTHASDQHDHYVLCDIAPGQTFSLEPRQPLQGLDAIQPGELGVWARGSHPGSSDYRNAQHMVITPAGRAYYTTSGLIQLADTQADWIRHLDNPARELRILQAPFFLTNNLMSLLYTSDDLRRTGAVTYDLLTGEVFTEGIEPYRYVGTLDEVDRASRSMGFSVVNTGPNGAIELRPKGSTDSSTEARRFPARTFLSGRHLVQALTVREEFERPLNTYIRVSDLLDDTPADPTECLDDLTIAGCALLEGVEAKVILPDRDGRLFALDITRQRLLKHRPDRGPGEWDVLVDGLVRPRDLEIRYHQGRAMALIMDGDILAVDTTSTNTITRRFE